MHVAVLTVESGHESAAPPRFLQTTYRLLTEGLRFRKDVNRLSADDTGQLDGRPEALAAI
jgi:hypothetical protein